MTARAGCDTPATGQRPRLGLVLEVLGRVPLSILKLFFRLAVAGVFLKAGLTKIASWEFEQLITERMSAAATPAAEGGEALAAPASPAARP